MWYILFGYLGFLIICIILSEVFVSKTKETIRYRPSFGRLLYVLSLFCWAGGGLLPYILSNFTFWLGIAIFVPLSFVFLLSSSILTFRYFKIENNFIVKRFCFTKKIIKYEDFVIVFKPGRVVGTSSKTGKELFVFTLYYINVNSFLEDYSKFAETRETNLESKIVGANKMQAIAAIAFGLLGFFSLTLVLLITVVLPNFIEEPIPLYAPIVLWIVVVIEFSFSIYWWLTYFFHYLVVDNDTIIVHKPFRYKKIYNSQNLHMELTLHFLKLKDDNNKLVFIAFLKYIQNHIVLYECLNKNLKDEL